MNLNNDEIWALQDRLSAVSNYIAIRELGYIFDKHHEISLEVEDRNYLTSYIEPTLGKGYIEHNEYIESELEEYGFIVPYDVSEYEFSGEKHTDGFTIIINNELISKSHKYGIFDESDIFLDLTDGYFMNTETSNEYDEVQIKYINELGLVIVVCSYYYLQIIEFVSSYVDFLKTLNKEVLTYEKEFIGG